jgi:uncharacterized protein (TIGR03000 family)
MIRKFQAAALLLAPLLLAAPAGAWPQIYPYHAGRYDVPPSVYGYPLDDPGAGYYGGANYKQYYGFGRGYGLADYPGPVPNYWGHPWFRYKYWPYDSRELPKVYEPDHDPNCACILIQVPPEAQVWMEGRSTKQTGTTRVYYSPPLPRNQSFAYQVRVAWTDATGGHEQAVDVTVKAGGQVRLSFPQPSSTEQVSFTPKLQPVPGK